MKADSKLGLFLLCGLALTACNSGVGYSAADGQEVDLSAMNKVFIDQAKAEDFDRHMVVCNGKGKRAEACVVICHVPPGNPDARHTIRINEAALDAHLEHGHKNAHQNVDRDYLGECQDNSDDGGSSDGGSSGGTDSGSGSDGSSGGTDSGGSVDSGSGSGDGSSSGDGTSSGGDNTGSTDGSSSGDNTGSTYGSSSGDSSGSTDSGSGSTDSGSGSTDSGSGSTDSGSGSGDDGSNTGSGGTTAPVCTVYPMTDRDQNCDGNDDVTGEVLY
jgi:hypothetical protein